MRSGRDWGRNLITEFQVTPIVNPTGVISAIVPMRPA